MENMIDNKEKIQPEDGSYAKVGNLEIRIDLTKLGDDTLPATNGTVPTAKYNVKLCRNDVMLIDELAKLENTSRAEIINKLIHDYLLHELESLDDLQIEALIAARADAIEQELSSDVEGKPFLFNLRGWCGEIKDIQKCTRSSFINLIKYNEFQADEVQPYCARGDVEENLSEEELIEKHHSDTFKKIRAILKEI